eukprot:scaffold107288_cov51-Phaeocystis_antarctica.AAC.2
MSKVPSHPTLALTLTLPPTLTISKGPGTLPSEQDAQRPPTDPQPLPLPLTTNPHPNPNPNPNPYPHPHPNQAAQRKAKKDKKAGIKKGGGGGEARPSGGDEEDVSHTAQGSNPRLADPRLADPRLADPRLADPRPADPRLADPRRVEPRPADPRPADPRREDEEDEKPPAKAAPVKAAPKAAPEPEKDLENAQVRAVSGGALQLDQVEVRLRRRGCHHVRRGNAYFGYTCYMTTPTIRLFSPPPCTPRLSILTMAALTIWLYFPPLGTPRLTYYMVHFPWVYSPLYQVRRGTGGRGRRPAERPGRPRGRRLALVHQAAAPEEAQGGCGRPWCVVAHRQAESFRGFHHAHDHAPGAAFARKDIAVYATTDKALDGRSTDLGSTTP